MSSVEGALRVWVQDSMPRAGTALSFNSPDDLNIKYRFPLSYYSDSEQEGLANINDVQIYSLNSEGKTKVVGSAVIFDGTNSGKGIFFGGLICSSKSAPYSGFINTEGKNSLLLKVVDVNKFLKNNSLSINGTSAEDFFVLNNNDLVIPFINPSKYLKFHVSGSDWSRSLISIESFNFDGEFIRKTHGVYDEALALRADKLGLINLKFSEGFYGRETSGARDWMWAQKAAEMSFDNGGEPISVEFEFDLAAPVAGDNVLEFIFNGLKMSDIKYDAVLKRHSVVLRLKNGANTVKFIGRDGFKPPNDPRLLSFQISNPCIL
jgi:hypothetical protein